MIGERGVKIYSGDIKIFGPRPSGKFTFLVALACHRNSSPYSPVLSVQSEGRDSEYLIGMGRDLLEHGFALPAIPMEEINSYCLSITLKSSFNIISVFHKGLIKLVASYTPYAGEWFEVLKTSGEWDSDLDYVFDDLASANQVIFLFDSTSSQRDTEYAQAISVLRDELSKRSNSPDDKKRYAIVFSKIDLSPEFFYLSDLNGFIRMKFPKLFSEFQKWSKHGNCSFRYFACSAFGMIGNPPKPNAVRAPDIGSNVDAGCGWALKEPNAWQPFGLVAPIYWLLTGKDDPRLLYYPLFS